MPTLLAYARLNTPLDYENAKAVGRVFTAHLRAFRAMVVLFTRGAGLPPDTTARLLVKCDELTDEGEANIHDNLIELLEDLQAVNREYGELLKTTARDQSVRLRNLFREETGPRRLITVHDEETWPMAGDLNAKLIESCWYDSEGSHERDGPLWLHTTDLVLLVPGRRPIRPDIEQAVVKANIPIVVLVGARAADDRQNMAALRTEHGYRHGNHTVIRRPFAPLRLFQAIDGCYLRHVAAQRIPSRSLEFVAM